MKHSNGFLMAILRQTGLHRRLVVTCGLCCLVLLCATTLSAQTLISSLSQITNMSGNYKLTGDISAGGNATISGTFRGTLDGGMYTIDGLTAPLFETVEDATICNLMLSNVQIAGNTGNTGAITGTANGATRIYNCGLLDTNSSISGTGNTGSIVGQLNGAARVINCFSYATITGGTTVAGIVGYNNNSSTASNLQTLVVNCMFYGDIEGGTTAYPIYGGTKISNEGSNGINNFNYFRQDATMNNLQQDYNCALAGEERFLRRWEFYRGILNSNRALVAYYINGNVADTQLVAKWVQVDEHPYPILKKWGRYPSQINSRYVMDFTARPTVTYDYNINYDIDYNDPAAVQALENKLATHYCGASLGTLTVNVNHGTYGSGSHAALVLPITDMDTHTANNRYDYCFRKVQLPYYNDLFSGNYTDGKVVTGWKITAVSGNSHNSYRAEDSDQGYNFADTTDIGKDLYSTSGRVFAQGGYYYVPQGVTAITIEAYWGNAVFLSDPGYDVVYSSNYGNHYSHGGNRPTTFNGRYVYTSLSAAVNAVAAGNSVYDNAIVLVGNVHQYCGTRNPTGSGELFTLSRRPFTVMSVDLDKDNEPDYCLFYQHANRARINPVRFDFLWQPGIGVAAKVDGNHTMPNVGIFLPQGWFEVTETAIAHYTEFEYDETKQQDAPLILNNGVYEQFVSAQGTPSQRTQYMLLGGHTWMKEFCNGIHAGSSRATRHIPISVVGGEFEKFYLSGTFRPSANVHTDNAECYINGGRFGEIAGGGQEQIRGNVTFKVNHALIDEFYGGGINKQNPITGDITVTMNNSVVGKYCGGPKFGNMSESKTVTTQAFGTVFGTYFGAGNGGTSLYKNNTKDNINATNEMLQGWITDYARGQYRNDNVVRTGIATGYSYEYFVWAGDGNPNNRVGRFYVYYASFDVAQTRNVSSALTRCMVTDNYYGGGNFGEVMGTATSTLTGTVVRGDVYAGGFSASVPTVDVYDTLSLEYPSFNAQTGLFSQEVLPAPIRFTWAHTDATITGANALDEANRLIMTNSDVTGLGVIHGDAKITVTGDSHSHIYGSLYGGGAMSRVAGNTAVNVMGNTKIDKNVYGGGNAGVVNGSTHVQVGGQEWQ